MAKKEKRLSEAQWRALYRLGQIKSGMVLHAHGHLRASCSKLVGRGFAQHLGDDKWTGAFFQITDAGDKYLRQNEPL